MANEGSTKPTYSELEWPAPQAANESDDDFFLRILREHRQSHADWIPHLEKRAPEGEYTRLALGNAEIQRADVRRYDKLIGIFERKCAELLGVRGLLQRQWISVEERLPEESLGWVLVLPSQEGMDEANWCDFRSALGETANTVWVRHKPNHRYFTHWMPLPAKGEPAEAHAAAEIATEPNEIRVCGKHIVSFAGNEPCGICGGAESADIGKLDRVDVCNCVGGCGLDSGLGTPAGKCARVIAENEAIAVSAETGGEKAAPESEIVELSLQAWQYAAYIGEWDAAQAEEWQAEAEVIEIKLHRAVSDLAKLRGLNFKQFPNFPRTSQNQTVSSGVEGAHEGTTADKSVALAESSLSSPLPRFHGHWFCPKCKQKAVNIYFDSESYRNHFRCENCEWHGDTPPAVVPTVRQSPSLAESGAESAHSGKQNTADKSELLPTQLPKADF